MNATELPATITGFLAAQEARDPAALEFLAPGAVVTDDGQTYRGADEIRGWLERAASEYTYTTTFAGATRHDPDHYDVRKRLEGNFPGGVVDLHYRFTLDDSTITRLVIEP